MTCILHFRFVAKIAFREFNDSPHEMSHCKYHIFTTLIFSNNCADVDISVILKMCLLCLKFDFGEN